MELRHLRYFVAVAEELNFRKAAERLRVAQPALSSQIKDLEGEIGVRLLDRNTASVRLTDAGRIFLEETRRTLQQAAAAIRAAQETAAGRRGRLAVGYSPLLLGFMPAGLKRFGEKYPEVDVSLVELAMGEQVAAVAAGSIQIGFAIAGTLPVPAGLKEASIVRSPVRLVVGRTHRFAKARRVALADLAREPLLCLANGRGTLVHFETMRPMFAARGLKPGPVKRIEGAEPFRAMLESGAGVTLMPEIASLSRSADLVFKPLRDSGDDLFLEIRALWHGATASALVENFLQVLRQMKHGGGVRVRSRAGGHGAK